MQQNNLSICQFTMNTWKDVVTRSYFKRMRPLFTSVISKVFVTRGWLKGLLILMIISSKIWNRWKNCWTNSLEENEYNLKISLMIQKLNARNKTTRPGKHILPNKTYHWLGPATNHEVKSPGCLRHIIEPLRRWYSLLCLSRIEGW